MCHAEGLARRLRLQDPGAICHVCGRMIGDERVQHSRLFRDVQDRQRLLERLAERGEPYRIRLFQLVLMTNHFRLVFETQEGNCDRFMHALVTAYTVYCNRGHRRHGHLVDGRYNAKLVEGDEYLLALTRYGHLNPAGVEPDTLRRGLRNSPLGAIAARMLIRFAGQTQRQVAGHLRMRTGGAVSAQVRKLPDLLAADRRLRSEVREAEARLAERKKATIATGRPHHR